MHSTGRDYLLNFQDKTEWIPASFWDIKAIAQTDEYKILVAEKIEITQHASSNWEWCNRFLFYGTALSAFQVSYEKMESYQEKK